MKRSLYFAGVLLLILAGAIGIARAEFGASHYAWGPHGGPGRFPAAYLAHELGLTDAQKTQIKGIFAVERHTVVPLLHGVLNECSEMASANANGTFDEAKTRAIADRESATISQLLVERQRIISKVYNDVLTPEQRVKADQLLERMHARVEGLLEHLEQSGD